MTRTRIDSHRSLGSIIAFAASIGIGVGIRFSAIADVICVDADAGNGGDGASWATAFNDLQDGLAAATAGDELWVAEGTYWPDDNTGDRTRTFLMKADVSLYGGFVGNESQRDQRDFVNNVTTLSGDLSEDDQPGFVNYGDNTYNVVSARFLAPGSATTLDGFLIRGGSAFGGNLDTRRGGGFNINSMEFSVTVSVRHCTFSENQAMIAGGGVFADAGTSTFDQCFFLENSSDGAGGGLEVSAPVTVTQCRFESNQGAGMRTSTLRANLLVRGCEFVANGGGLHASGTLNQWTLTIDDCVFAENVAGGLRVFDLRVNLARSRFVGNSAGVGAGARLESDVTTAIMNCRFSGNQATLSDGGGLFLTDQADHVIANCVFTGNDSAGSGGGTLCRAFDWYTGAHNCELHVCGEFRDG